MGLEGVLNEAIERFTPQIEVGFYANGSTPWQKPFVVDSWFKKFAKQGFGIIDKAAVVDKIGNRLRERFPRLKWSVSKTNNYNGHYNTLYMSEFDNLEDLANEYL